MLLFTFQLTALITLLCFSTFTTILQLILVLLALELEITIAFPAPIG